MKSNIKASTSINVHAPVSEVWNALTKPEIIKQYFFGTDTHTDWRVGSPIRFTGEWEGKTYEDKGTIKEYEYHKKIAYSYWSSMSGIEDRPENYVTVTYELTEKDNNTKLTISQENIPDEKRKEHSVENWKKVLKGLKDVVEQKHVEA